VKRRPTQKDVARLAEVSPATVSYVINNLSGGNIRISDETRRRVWKAIEELGYQINVNARSLRTQKTQLLAVMVPDLTNPFYPLMIRGAQSLAEENEYQLLVYDTNDSKERELIFIEAMLRRRVDGVVLVSFHLEVQDAIRLLEAGIVIVSVGGRLRDAGFDVIATPEREAACDMVEYLLLKGHRRIAHLSGPQDTPAGRARLEGYCQALSQAGIAFDERLILPGTFTHDRTVELIHAFLDGISEEDRPTALFAANDLMAIDAIQTFKKRGYKVPGDIAVAGFDNIPEAEVIEPPLTTVGHDARNMGWQAVKLLLERIESEEDLQPRTVSIPYYLVPRTSA
jgi:LacI family transcriptional regulator